MRKFAALLFVVLALGCGGSQSNEKPVLLCEQEGVKVWKIRDRTYGGANYVYFTTGGGHIIRTSADENDVGTANPSSRGSAKAEGK